MAGKWRALLTAQGGTCAVAAMAPGFVIAFLGVALGPLEVVVAEVEFCLALAPLVIHSEAAEWQWVSEEMV